MKRISLALLTLFALVSVAQADNIRWGKKNRIYGDNTFPGPVTFEGTVGLQGTTTYTFGAAEYLQLDADTTDTTTTGGVLDINMGTVTNGAEGVNVDVNIGDTGAGVTATGILVDLDDDTSANSATIDGVTVNASDVAGQASTVVTGFKSTGNDVGFSATVPAASRGVVIDAATTDNTNTSGGAVSITYDTVTNGGEGVFIDMGVGDTGAGVTAAAVEIDIDDDTSSNAATIYGVDVNVSDASGNASTNIIGFRASAAEIAFQADPGAAGQGFTVDAASTFNQRTDGVVEVLHNTITDAAESVFIDLGVGNTTGAATVTGVLVDVDDDTVDNAGTIRAFSATSSDIAGHANTTNTAFYTSGMDVAFQADNGYLRLGTGSTPDVTPGDDDAFIEGTIEVDGAARFDGAVTLTSTLSGTTGALSTPKLTAGTGTGVTVNDVGSLRTQVYKVTVGYQNFTSAAVTHDLTIATLPAKSIVHAVYADVTQAFVCAAVCTTATLSATVGVTAGGNQFLLSFDIDAAVATFGDADGEMGAGLSAVGASNGGYTSWAGVAVNMRGTSGTGNWGDGASATNLNAGSITFYILASVLP